ncbi:MAG: DMT family transporter [Campylobacteraceae bacterium]
MGVRLKEIGADFSLFLVAIAWGTTFVIVQRATDENPVYTFLFWRFLLATILMALFSIKHFKKIDKVTVFGGVVLGVFLFLGYAFQTFGLRYTYSSTVGFITGLNVVIVPLIMYFCFKKKISVFAIFGILTAVVGLYFLALKDSISLGKGEFYTLICAAMFAAQIVYTSYFAQRTNVFLLVTIQLGVVSLLCLFGMFALNNPIMPPKLDQLFINAIILTAVFATVFAFFVQTYMQQFTTAVKTAIIFTAEPVIAGVFGYFYANEMLTKLQIFGAVLIICGMLIAEIGSYIGEKRKLKKAN